MNIVKNLSNHIRYITTSKLLVIGGTLLLASAGLVLNTLTQSHQANAAGMIRDNNSNSIIWGGCLTPAECVQHYHENKTGDIPAIYSFYGLQPGDLDRFVQQAKLGYAYKNGNLVVDGRVVMTNMSTIGRNNRPGATPVVIAGHTYYSRPNNLAFKSDPIPAHVLMSPDGKHVDFFALTSCSNTGTGTQPNYNCDMLNVKQDSRTAFEFTANVTANNGASVQKLVYNFGDGQTAESTNPSQPVTHTYDKPGDYTATVTVFFDVNGTPITGTSANCAKPIKVLPPPTVACSVLDVKAIARDQYQFTAKATLTNVTNNNAALTGGDFDFGDGQTATGIKPSDETHVVSPVHTYTEEGDHTIVATLHFTVEGQTVNQNCQTKITVTPQPCALNPALPANSPECKPCASNPSVAVNSPECQPCAANPNVPANSAQCTPPTTPPSTPPAAPAPPSLPSTGPTEIVGGTLGLSSIVGAGVHYARTRRSLLSSFLNR